MIRDDRVERSRRPVQRSIGASIFAIAGLLLVRVVVVLMTLAGPGIGGHHAPLQGDVQRYLAIARSRGTPYRDFSVEYPPVTLAAIEALDTGSLRAATVQLMWSQVALDAVVAGLLLWGWGRRPAIAYLLLGLPFLAYPFLYLRLDLLSVALALGAIAAFRRGHHRTSGLLLAAACLAKLWPVVLIGWFVVRGAGRTIRWFSALAFAGLGGWVLWGGLEGPIQVLTFRGASGWQIESIVGAVVRTVSSAPVRIESGADRVGNVPLAAELALLAIAGMIIAIAWRSVRPSDSPPGDVIRRDGLAPLVAVGGLLVTATILSPQYVCWILPFAAIATSDGEPVIGVLTTLIVGLSVFGFSVIHSLNRGDPLPVATVLIRNVLLIALVLVAYRSLTRRRPSESPRPVTPELPTELPQDLHTFTIGIPPTGS